MPNCRKCQGFLAIEWGDGRCVNCGMTYTEAELADLEAAAVVEQLGEPVNRATVQDLVMAPPVTRRKEGEMGGSGARNDDGSFRRRLAARRGMEKLGEEDDAPRESTPRRGRPPAAAKGDRTVADTNGYELH